MQQNTIKTNKNHKLSSTPRDELCKLQFSFVGLTSFYLSSCPRRLSPHVATTASQRDASRAEGHILLHIAGERPCRGHATDPAFKK
eukprot:1391392-Amphidinium_carterae.1